MGDKGVIVRFEKPENIPIIRQITKAAFAPLEYSSQTEAEIIDALREAGALTVSLVALLEGVVVGHVAFSPVKIDGRDMAWFGLGPIAVRPDCQKNGIGEKLVRDGLSRLVHLGAKGCVVQGNPQYYRRFGFENDVALIYEGPPAEYFMRLVFSGQAPSGQVNFHKGFSAT